MLTQGEDVEVHALASRGWTVSAIARHLGRTVGPVRAYVRGERRPGARRRSAGPAGAVGAYVAERFSEDPHISATAL